MHPLKKIPRKNWPVQVEEFAKVVGDEAALALFIRFNGRCLTIPIKNPGADHVLVETIGMEKTVLLCNAFGGACEFNIPKSAYLLRRIRNDNIKNDHTQGMKVCDLATNYDLTTRQISNIINH
jgi:hypothetical protein